MLEPIANLSQVLRELSHIISHDSRPDRARVMLCKMHTPPKSRRPTSKQKQIVNEKNNHKQLLHTSAASCYTHNTSAPNGGKVPDCFT
jgi:hypothetical protein